MSSRSLVAIALLGSGVFSLLQAQDPPPRSVLNRELPRWLALDIQQRLRAETWGDIAFDPQDDDSFFVNRLMVGVDVRPRNNVRVYAQAMDSRVTGMNPNRARPPMTEPLDLRQAFVQLGDPDRGSWDLTVGRQELVFGFERTVGINIWQNLPRSWDAVRLGLHRGKDRVDLFASSIVEFDPRGFNPGLNGANLHGVYGRLRSLVPGHALEPHLLWRTRPAVVDERGATSGADTFTLGARFEEDRDNPFHYETELEMQWGHFGGDPHRAFLGMGQIAYAFETTPLAPRVLLEYTFATGDEDRSDGQSRRYDQFFARAHRVWGIVDQVGGRNVKILQQALQLRPSSKWQLRFDHLSYWLANPHDNLYRHNGQLFLRVPATNTVTYIGEEVEAQITWRPKPELAIGFGLGKLFSGGVIKRYSPGGSPLLGFIFAELEL